MKKSKVLLSLVVVVAVLASGLVGCATFAVNPIPTSPEEAKNVEEAYKLVFTLYLAHSIKESEWRAVKKAYDEYRQALIELKAQHELVKAGQPIDLTAYADRVAGLLAGFWGLQANTVTNATTAPAAPATTGGD